MSRCIEADYDQVYMFPPCLEDWIPPDHPARFIRAFVLEALSNGVELDWGSQSLEGHPHYSPRLLLGVWLYGYFQRILSTRRLEAACRNDVGMIWLCGNRAPDHNTLWRFFRRNRKALRSVFKQTVRVAVKAELVGFVLHALDGTKVQAHVANRSGHHRKALEAALLDLDEKVAAIEAAIAEAQARDGEEWETALPERLQSAQDMRETIQKALGELDAEQTDHLHPHDRDAKVMKCADRNMNTFGYNNQAVVDEKSRLIVAERATQEATDLRLLAEMVQQVEDECGQAASTTVADAGYAASTPLHQAQQAGHPVLVNLPKPLQRDPKEPFKAANFNFDPERNVVVCPLGQDLEYTHTRWHAGKGQYLRAYRCRNKDCPLRAQCSKDRKGRKIELVEHYEALQAQRDAHSGPGARQTLAKRRYVVEPVFAWIKQHLGFRRCTVNGIHGAQAQWSLACATYNLNRLYALWKNGGLHRPQTPQRISNPHPTIGCLVPLRTIQTLKPQARCAAM
jgi:transposase